MTREDAIAILKRKSTIPDDDYCWDEIEGAFDMAIESLESQKTGHWIPISERLPNFNDIVLTSVDSDYDELRVILTVYSAEEFWFNGKIKAWMPLPEPYEAESKELKGENK